MEQEIKKLQMEVQELRRKIKEFESSTTIPLFVAEAFKVRTYPLNILSTKTTASETQAVNESGSSSYSVAKVPDGFIKIKDGRNIPYYND